MRKFFIFAAFLCTIQMTPALVTSALANESIIAVIVANNQSIDDLKLAPNQLSLIYWRKQLYWPKGLRIKPVNLRSEHPLRQQFSQTILGGLPKTQVDYWNGQYFNGVLPPYSVNSEEAVLRYVTQTNGAIGYINACAVDNRVQAVFWLMPNGNILPSKPALDCGN
jgi:ABC-type phosphate transport system substrate-binding protein